ncbi:MAG: septal ring lytic transglycosylase RlpA family protein [Methylobacterium sp.]|uniref:septal ring lytic transglycosylase RlpA family protein n=1 Tax=Methylobacterium sp. TaxID=409 RepID=UPI0025D5044F|nr:septal ring lytic transglycosylase RlpA family protein [Methylobacterium sp.]MBX9931097.1 septal ring lytic transglycosylase RlpA family protein [Methylobacterium sp.]
MVRVSKAGRLLPRTAPVWQVLAVTALALTTANCAGKPPQMAASGGGSGIDPKYGVKASPRIYNEGDVIPKGGGRRFSGKPYVVAGRTYVPREEAKGYVREGLASWYGSAFHGRLTANGEVFDRMSIAAAHPTLPLPSYARVTNLANGHSMVVRVNDRGPYHADRLMDVSEEVAQALDFRRRGTAKVRVEYVGKASTAGSDDAKLMATLRTDGQPATIRGRSPVMLADLGPEPPPSAAKPPRTALAFRAAAEEGEPAPRVERQAETRPAPILAAAPASVAVPAAVQPTRTRNAAFEPVRPDPRSRAEEASRQPMSLAPPPIRLAGARHDGASETRAPAPLAARAAPAPARFAAGPDQRPAQFRAAALPHSNTALPKTALAKTAFATTTLTKTPPATSVLIKTAAGHPVPGRMAAAPVKPAFAPAGLPSGAGNRAMTAAKPAPLGVKAPATKTAAAPTAMPPRRARLAGVE